MKVCTKRKLRSVVLNKMKLEIVTKGGKLKGRLKHILKEHARINNVTYFDGYLEAMCLRYVEENNLHLVETCPDKSKRIVGAQWNDLRSLLFKTVDNICAKCGSTNNLQADHVYPVSFFPEKQLDINNLQILCRTCNLEKSNKQIIKYK
jgi:hypothetical protein